MNLTQEEWLIIKDWLHELLGYHEEQAKIYENYRYGEYHRKEYDSIKEFLHRKSN